MREQTKKGWRTAIQGKGMLLAAILTGAAMTVAMPTQAQVTFEDLTFEQAQKKAENEGKIIFVDVMRPGPTLEANQRVEKEIFTLDSIRAFFRDNVVSIRMDMGSEAGKAFAPNLNMLMYPAYVFYDAKGAQLQYTNAHAVQNNPTLLMEKARASAAVADEKKANTRSITFENGSWESILQQAKAQGKLIFLDAQTEWCRPCRMMERDVFTLDRVADFYNDNFINVSMDMEKGDGPALAKKHGIRAYPTYLFIDGDGNVVHRDEGYKQPDVFLEVGRAALAKIQAGVVFVDGDWESILNRAGEEDKLIFLDAYAVWCGPCKAMDRDVFPRPEVGEFFNTQFINVKRDMEKGEGLTLRERYDVRAYPTYLFINSKGEEVHRIVGSSSAEAFVERAQAALNPDMQRASLEARYVAGERSADFIKQYVDVLSTAYFRDEAAAVAQDYLENLPSGELLTEEHWEMTKRYLNDPTSPVLRHYAVNRDQLESIGVENPDNEIADLYSRGIYELYNAQREQSSHARDLRLVKRSMKKARLADAAELNRLGTLLESAQRENWKKFASTLNKVVRKEKKIYGQTVPVTITQFAPRLLRATGAQYSAEVLAWTDVLLSRIDHKLDQSKLYNLQQLAYEQAGDEVKAAAAAEHSKLLVAQWQEENKGSGMMMAVPMKLQ